MCIVDGMEYALPAAVVQKVRKDIVRWGEPAVAKASAFEFLALVGGFIDETEATADDGFSDEGSEALFAAIERDLALGGMLGSRQGAQGNGGTV